MSEPFLGQIQTFGFTFAPRGWVNCDGQLLPINQYQALFSLLGTTYGGDGRTTFGIPGMRGRVPIHTGSGAGLPTYKLGQKGGAATVQLNDTQIPAHKHTYAVPCNTGDGESDEPKDNYYAKAAGGETIYATAATANSSLGGTLLTGTKGGGQAHNNLQPYLTIRFCCATQGTFPSRN